MNFDLDKSIELLERSPKIYKALFYDLKHNWGTIREGENSWSGYNIIGHLIHGEKTDWIARAKIILSDEAPNTFEPYDRFAQDKLYSHQSMEELLDMFETLRAENIRQLRSWKLTEADLNKTAIHPGLGQVTMRELLSTWTVHDLAHLNQATRVLARHYTHDVGPWTDYISILKKA